MQSSQTLLKWNDRISVLGFLIKIPINVLMIAFVSFSVGEISAKPVICSATLNSENEINQFKTHLNSDATFVELTQFGSNLSSTEGWLEKACEKNIQCDVLIISGHYSDHFFGNGLHMRLTTMESKSCSNKCPGIFSRPKEIHLLGCNTLADKANASLSGAVPSFVQALRRDGYSEESIREQVSELFSPVGLSMKDRFQMVFSSSPRIFGYTTIGPTGKQVEPFYDRYLRQTRDYYRNMGIYNKSDLLVRNQAIASVMQGRVPLAQVSGNSFQHEKMTEMYCRTSMSASLNSNDIKDLERIVAKDPVRRIDFLQRWLGTMIERRGISTAQLEAKNFFQRNHEIRETLERHFNKTTSLFDALIVGEILTLGQSLAKAEYLNQTSRLYQRRERAANSLEASRVVCSTRKKLIDPAKAIEHLVNIKENLVSSLEILNCIPMGDMRIVEELLNTFDQANDILSRRTIIDVIEKQLSSNIKMSDSQIRGLWNRYLNDQDVQIKRYLLRSLGKLGTRTQFLKSEFKAELGRTQAPILTYELAKLVE